MKLISRETSTSPDRVECCRVSATFLMEMDGREMTVWFDVPAALEESVSTSGNPWLTLMIPMAGECGEDVSLPYPVDVHLLENLRAKMRFRSHKLPGVRLTQIDAPVVVTSQRSGDQVGLFFSGGIDSTFSLLRHDDVAAGCGSGVANDLVFVAGFDIPVDHRSEIDQVQSHLQSISGSRGKNLVLLATNLREIGSAFGARWLLNYGYGLATVGHLLDGRYRELLISAPHTHFDPVVTGSHPITDPLLSSRNLRFVQDGAAFNRVEKTRQIAADESSLRSLRVCWESRRHDNCSRCAKCLLTMVALDLVGYRDRAECFDWSDYSPDRVRNRLLDGEAQLIFFRELLAEAHHQGRQDVERAVADTIANSQSIQRIAAWVRRLPVLWRYEYQLTRFLLNRTARSDGARN